MCAHNVCCLAASMVWFSVVLHLDPSMHFRSAGDAIATSSAVEMKGSGHETRFSSSNKILNTTSRPQVLEVSGMQCLLLFSYPRCYFLPRILLCPGVLVSLTRHLPKAGETSDSLDQLLVIHIHDVVASCARGKCAQRDNHVRNTAL